MLGFQGLGYGSSDGPQCGLLNPGSLHTYCRPYTLFVPLRSQRFKGPYERTVLPTTVLPTLELTIWGNLGLRDGSRIQGFRV